MSSVFRSSHPRAFGRGIASWPPVALAVLALLYLAAGVIAAAHGDEARAVIPLGAPGLLPPLRLFLLAIAPACAVHGLLWAERALTDPRPRRAVRAAAILGAGLAVVILAGGLPS